MSELKFPGITPVVPSVTAVIVTHNGAEWLPRCLDSLASSTVPVQVILIDNASTDSTLKIASSRSAIETIALTENVGFSQANNIGITRAIASGADYVLLLNQDAWIAPDTLQVLIDVMQNCPTLAIASPLHWDQDGSQLDLNFQAYLYQGAYQILRDLLRNNLQTVYLVPFVNAAIWLVTRDCIERVGGFDPLYFMYAEDNDYCRRVTNQKLEIGIVPAAHGYHARGKAGSPPSTHRQRVIKRAERIRSDLVYMLKDPSHSMRRMLVGQTVSLVRMTLATIVRHPNNWTEMTAQWIAFATTLPRLSIIAARRRTGDYLPVCEPGISLSSHSDN